MNDSYLNAVAHECGNNSIDTQAAHPVVTPPDVEALRACVRLAREHTASLTVRGGGTLPVSGMPDSAVVISVAALNEISRLERLDFSMTAGAGVTVDAARTAATGESLVFPFDLLSGETAQIGGSFAAAASGTTDTASGPFIDMVTGVRFVSADGDLITGGGRTPKNVTGFDLTRFMYGTMGVYGIITELTVRLSPSPEQQLVLRARTANGAGVSSALQVFLRRRRRPALCELAAPAGVSGESLWYLGYTGPAQVVAHDRAFAARTLEGAEFADMSDGVTARLECRNIITPMIEDDPAVFRFPPAAASVLVDTLRLHAPDVPAYIRPFAGWAVVAIPPGTRCDTIARLMRAAGGKKPRRWTVPGADFAARFDDRQRAVVRTLKHELDPHNILSPHLLTV